MSDFDDYTAVPEKNLPYSLYFWTDVSPSPSRLEFILVSKISVQQLPTITFALLYLN